MSDEGKWKRRFAVVMAVRLSGTLLVLCGLLLAFGDTIVAGGNRVAGLCLCIAGLIALILFPAMIRHHWRGE